MTGIIDVKLPLTMGSKYRIARQPHGAKGPKFDEVYGVSYLSAKFGWDEDGRHEPREWQVSFSREGEYGGTQSISATLRDGGWYHPYALSDKPLDWKVEKIDE